MQDERKTKRQLVDELNHLRRQIIEFDKSGFESTLKRVKFDIWKRLFEQAERGVVVGSPDGKRLEFMNPAFAKMHGYRVKELRKKPIAALLAPESREQFPKHIQIAHEKGHSTFESKHIRKDGTVFPALVDVTTVKDEKGEVLHRVVNVQDITEQKLAEEMLQKERDALQKYLDIIGVILVVIDSEQNVTLINKKGCEILEFDEKEIIGKNWFDTFIPEEMRDDVKAAFVKLMSGEVEPVEFFENPVLTRNNEERIIAWHNTVLTDEQGAIVGTLSSGEDITVRERTEEALRESEKKYRNLVDDALVGIYKTNLKGEILYANEALTKMFEFDSPEEAMSGTALERYKNPREREALLEGLKKKGKVNNLELEIFTKTGETKNVLISATLEGDVLSGMVLDITERKKAEERLEQALAELRHSNAELEQFAYVASHDLKEPLLSVASNLKLLKRRCKGKIEPDADEFIANAIDGVTRMQTLISDLLEYSRVGARRRTFKSTDCAAVLREALENLKTIIEESGAHVTHDPLPHVMGDPGQLRQLLQNLISNAIKFRGENIPCIHISAGKQGKDWVLSVRDNGIGIPAEESERIFDLLYRFHKQEYPGTGIGLAVCKKIVEQQGGRIWVQSEPGRGSTFYFSVPAGEERA